VEVDLVYSNKAIQQLYYDSSFFDEKFIDEQTANHDASVYVPGSSNGNAELMIDGYANDAVPWATFSPPTGGLDYIRKGASNTITVLPIISDASQGWTYIVVHIAPNGGMFELKRVKITWGSTTFFPSHYTLRVAAHSGTYNMQVVASAATMFSSNASSSAYLDIVKSQKKEFPYDHSVPGYQPVCRNELGDTCEGCTEIINLPRGWDASYVILNLSRYAGFGSTFGEPGVAYSVAEIEVQAACISEVCTLVGNSAGYGYVDGDGRIQNRQGGIKFNRPSSLVLSKDRNFIFVMDSGNKAIRKVSVDSFQVTSLAGGYAGYADGSRAKFAELSHMIMHPDGVRLFVTDAENNNIRCINTTSGYTDTLTGSIAGGYIDGFTRESRWNSPRGIAVSTSGDIYVADCGNNRIRKIVLPTGNVTTLAGNGVGGLADGVGTLAEIKAPWGLTVSPDGRHIYFSMLGGFRLRRISLETSEVYTLAGRSEGSYSGIGMHAQFGHTFMDQAVWGEDGKVIYFTDSGSNIIRYFEVTNQYVGALAGANPGGKPGGVKNLAGYLDGDATSALFNSPFGIAIDRTRGLIYASDSNGHKLRTITFRSRTPKFNLPGGHYSLNPRQTAVSIIAWAGDGIPVFFTTDGSEPTLNSPSMVPTFNWNRLCNECEGAGEQADEGMVTLRECQSLCSLDRRCISINHDGNQDLPGLCMLNIVSSPDHWSFNLDVFPAFEANACTRRTQENGIWCAEGPAIATTPSRRRLHLYKPKLCVDSSEGVLELKGGKHVVRAISKTPGLPPSSRTYMEVRVTEFEVNTFAGHHEKGHIDGYGSHAHFGQPAGVAIVSSGTIFVSDRTYNSIRTIDSLKGVSTTIGKQESSTYFPSKLAVSGSGRDLFVIDFVMNADVGGSRIQHLELAEGSQNLTSYRTLAGSLQGIEGNQDGVGDEARFHGIQGITLSEHGSALIVYVTCPQTHCIRRVDVSSAEVSTLLGSGHADIFGNADGTSSQALFESPWSIVVSSDQHHLYVSELRASRIRKVQLPVTRNGLNIPLMVSTIEAVGQDGSIFLFHSRVELAMGTGLDTLWIGDNGNFTVHALSLPSSKVYATYGSGTKAHVDAMQHDSSFLGFGQLALAQDGSVLFATCETSPTIRSIFTGRVYSPQSFDPPSGRYFVTSTGTSSLSIFLPGVPSGCRSKDAARPCVFPFMYGGKYYKGCTDVDDAPGRLWCATTDSYDRDGERANCLCSSPEHLSAVFYTTDGSEPTLKSSVYDADIGMQLHGFGERSVKVKNFREGFFDSPIAEASYSILPQTVSTMAGSSAGYQDSFGTFAEFSNPTKLVISFDNQDLYIADTGNCKIRRFNMQSGFTSTLAGGSKGFSDGVGTNAEFDQPHGLALTGDGAYLYVGDSGNGKIRKIEVMSGTVQTVFTREHAQTLYLFKRSDEMISMMSTEQNVYRSSMIYELGWVDNDHEVRCKSNPFTDSKGHQCVDYKTHPQWCGFEASAHSCCICGGGADIIVKRNTSSHFFGGIRELALSLDETVLYVCDVEKHTVNAIILSTGQIRIIAGGGANSSKNTAYGTRAGFNRPFGLDVSLKTASGLSQKGETLYIVDQGSIRTIDTVSGLVRGVLAHPDDPQTCDDSNFFCNNGCMASSAVFNPRDIVMSPDGYTAYVSDTTGIRALTQQGVCHVAGGSSLRSEGVDSWDRSCARFAGEYGGGVEIISPANPNATTPTILVADTRNNKIRGASIDPDPSHCMNSLNCPVCGDGNVQIDGVDTGFEACDARTPFNHIEGCTYYCRVLPGYVCDWDFIGNVSCPQDSLLSVLDFRVDSDIICKSKCDATLNCAFSTFLKSTGTCKLHSNVCRNRFQAQVGYETWGRSVQTTKCSSVCGDGVRLFAYEQCDDRNLRINDGCSDACTVEVGWHCQGGSNAPIQEADAKMDVCQPICGDKLRVGSEISTLKCDDGSRDNGDGCSEACDIEVPHKIDDIAITRMNRTQAFMQWRHMPLSSSAKLSDSLHRVYYYIAMVNRTLCVDGQCAEKLTNLTFNYSTCPYEVQLQPSITSAGSAWACERTCWGMPSGIPGMKTCVYATYSSSDLVEYDVGDFLPKCTLYVYDCPLVSVQNTYGSSVMASCDETFCAFHQNDLQPGEFLNVTVVSVNVAGFSSPRKAGTRWTVVPTQDIVFDYGELPVARSDWQRDGLQIVLFWYPPADTGWGDSWELPILEYRIEVSLCDSFDASNTLCGPTWEQNYIPGTFVAGTTIDTETINLTTYSGLEQSTCSRGAWEKWYDCTGRDQGVPFAYPFQLNVTFDLHNGFYYFYRFMSRNKQGWSEYSDSVRHQYGTLPFERPFVDLPALLPIPTAVVVYESTRSLHVWSNRESMDDETTVHVSGFPDIRSAEGLVLSFDLLGFTSPGRVTRIVGSTLATGMTIVYEAPVLPEELMRRCKDLCIATVTLIAKRWDAKFALFSLRYFYYPLTTIDVIKPTLGPISGGRIVKIGLIEPTGPLTRQGSGSESFTLAFDQQLPITVHFSCLSSLNVADKVTIAKREGTQDLIDLNSFELSVKSPSSNAGPCMAELRVHISNVRFQDFKFQNLALSYEYVGSKIMSVVPPAGMLNPGSGGVQVIVILSNLPTISITTTLAGTDCKNALHSQWDSDAGDLMSFSVELPEMPLTQAGSIQLRISFASSMWSTTDFDFEWQYELPPSTYIDKDSITIDGEKRLWISAGYSQHTCMLLVRNLSPKYAIYFDDIRVEIGGYQVKDPYFFRVGNDVQVSFQMSNATMPAMSKLVVTTTELGIKTSSTHVFNDGDSAFIEFKDESEPGLSSLAPSEGPSVGGTVIRLGLISIPDYLMKPGGLEIECTFTTNSSIQKATVLHQMSLSEWKAGGKDSTQFVSQPLVGSFLAGMSSRVSAQYSMVVEQTEKYANNFEKSNALQSSFILHVLVPPAPAHMSDPSASKILMKIGNVSVTGKYVYQPDPTGSLVMQASTASGHMKSGLGGGVKIAVSLANFAMIDTVEAVHIEFGNIKMRPFRLISSTREETKLVIVAPQGDPGVITVVLYSTRLSSSSASFQFTYFDDRKPVVLSFSPFQFYEAGGAAMHVRVKGLVFHASVLDVRKAINVGTRSGQGLSFFTHPFEVTVDFDIVEFSFYVPQGLKGMATFIISSGQMTADPVNFEYASLPDGIPRVLSVSPTTIRNNGGDSLKIVVENMKMIDSISNLRLTFTLGSTVVSVSSDSNSALQMASQISQTTISLPSPVFEVGGIVAVEVWELGLEDKKLSTTIPMENVHQSMLLSAYPTRSIASKSHTLDVIIKRFGPVISKQEVFVFLHAPTIGSASIEEYFTKEQDENDDVITLTVSFVLFKDNYAPFSVSVGNCLQVDQCLLKTVQFTVQMLNPNDVFVVSSAPMTGSVDGNVYLTVVVNKLQRSLAPVDLKVRFGTTKTADILYIEYFAPGSTVAMGPSEVIDTWNAEILCVLPQSKFPDTMTPVLEFGSDSLAFPEQFRYTREMEPIIERAAPMKAQLSVSSRIVITVHDFPGIQSISDVVVEIRCSEGSSAEATVQSYSSVDPSKYWLSTQSYTITADTPIGTALIQDTCQMVVFNLRFRYREAYLKGFRMVDSREPQISGISSEYRKTGIDSVKVKMSSTTELRVVLNNAPGEVARVIIGEQEVETKLSYYDASDKNGAALFSSPERDFDGTVYGLLLFSSGCACHTSCCSSFTCSACACKTICFSLVYYDDLLPKISYLSSSTGPSIGGTSIKLKITRFSIVKVSSDVTAKFVSSIGKVGVVYSGFEETSLIIESPAVDMGGLTSKSVDVILYAVSRPDRKIKFTYMFYLASQFVRTVAPSSGPKSGGILVRIAIDYFPFPSDVAVKIGDINIPSKQISMSMSSNLERTIFTFVSPSASPGQYEVKFIPRSCLLCGSPVTTTFEILQSVPLEILLPKPQSSMYRPAIPSRELLRISGAESNTTLPNISLTFSLVADTSDTKKAVTISYQKLAGTDESVIEFEPIALSRPGMTTAKLVITTASGTRTAEFAYLFFVHTAMRVRAVQPNSLPISIIMYGKTVELTAECSITISNFPQQYPLSDLSVLFASGKSATIMGLKHVEIACLSSENNLTCSETVITARVPAPESAASMQGTISAAGIPLQDFSLEYFNPCAYEAFCSGLSLIADVYRITEEIPQSSLCEVKYCVDPNMLPASAVISYLPSTGPSIGGTTISVTLRNLSVFSKTDIAVQFGRGTSTAMQGVESLSLRPGSTLLSSECTITFQTPAVKGRRAKANSLEPIVISVSWGALRQSAYFDFEYTPVIMGNPTIASFEPRKIVAQVETEIKVRLLNFPKIVDMLGGVAQIQVAVQAKGNPVVKAITIKSSTFESSLLILSLEMQEAGEAQVSLYHISSGPDATISFVVLVLSKAVPHVTSFFPLVGRAGESRRIRVSVKDLPVIEVSSLTVYVFFKEQQLAVRSTKVEDLRSQGAGFVTVSLLIPGIDIPPNGGPAEIILESGDMRADFTMGFDSRTTPQVIDVSPASLDVTTVGANIDVYLSNAPSLSCAAGCSVTFGTAVGSVISFSFNNGVTRVKIRAPNRKIVGSHQVKLLSNVANVLFTFPITLPGALVEPVDGTCNGASSVTIIALGWGQSTTDLNNISVSFNDQPSTISKIIYSIANTTWSGTSIVAKVPDLGLDRGMASGVIKLNEMLLSFFSFECFAVASGYVFPARATLQGKTTHADGRSVDIWLSNFPHVSKPSDLRITFGTIKCDGINCALLAFENSVQGVRVTVSAPLSPYVDEVDLEIVFTGSHGSSIKSVNKLQVSTSRFSERKISMKFDFFLPTPSLSSARWCQKCLGSKPCIENDRCADGSRPIANSVPFSGMGVVTLVIRDIVPVQGSLPVPTANVRIQFNGDQFGTLHRVVYSSETASSFEFRFPQGLPVGDCFADVIVTPDTDVSFFQTFRFVLQIFNDRVQLDCEAPSECMGSSAGGNRFNVLLKDFPLTLSGGLDVRFGSTSATAVTVLETDMKRTKISVTSPAFDCALCQVSNGIARVTLAVNLGGVRIGQTIYSYRSPPRLVAAIFDSSMTSIELKFDQPINRGGILNVNGCACGILFEKPSLDMLGEKARCVWQSNECFVVFLASDASVLPGNKLVLKSSSLTSENGQSASVDSWIVVAKPLVMKAPSVMIVGPARIDVCTSLDLRSAVSSPRQVSYTWRCANDATTDVFLRTVSSSALFMSEGTPEMPTLEKSYQIVLSVTDFFGMESEPYLFFLTKTRNPTPTLQFVPSTLTLFQDQEANVRAEATFSACPVPQSDLIFTWKQISGPRIPEHYLNSGNPRFYAPPNVLEPGSEFELVSTLSMQGQPAVENVFILRTGIRPLVTLITGAPDKQIFAKVGFVLSAEESFDPNMKDSADRTGLIFRWLCEMTEDSVVVPCRNASGGSLTFLPTSRIHVPPETLLPVDQKYVFTVSVSKQARSSSSARVSILVLATAVTALDTTVLSGGSLIGRTLYINPKSTLSINASSDVVGTSFEWVLDPAWRAESSEVVKDGLTSNFIVLDGPFALLVPGSSYSIKVLGRSTNSSGVASLEVQVNNPPVSGVFTACRKGAAERICLSTGFAILDTFRLSCNGWIDNELPLTFIFGYNLVASNISATSSQNYWWEPMLDFARDASFPSGSVTAMVQIVDGLGAATDVVTSQLLVQSSGTLLPGQRRLLATPSLFYAQATEKLSEAQRLSRADQVNQLAGAIAVESTTAITVNEATSLRGDLMSSLVSGSGKAIRTLSFACEVFGAAALVMNATELVNDIAVLESGNVLRRLVLEVSHQQLVDSGCALNAATMISSAMQAQSSRSDILWVNSSLVPELNNRSVHMLDLHGGIAFLQSIEHGSTEFMTRVIWNAVAGGPERTIFANASRHTMARAKLVDLTNRTIRQASPLYDSVLQPAAVTFPSNIAEDLPMMANMEVDVHLQGHSHAPAATGLWIRSHLFGATLSLRHGGGVLNIKNLSSPIKLHLPVHTYRMSAREQMLFTQQARCVFWMHDSYQTAGCSVVAVDEHVPSQSAWPKVLPLSLVTVESRHLTLFAINQDYTAPACGDSIIQATGGGIVQRYEECDDEDIDSGDGCSSSCTVEANFTCFTVPSVCVAWPAPFGIQAIISLGDFYSLYDFTRYIDKFAMGMSTSIGLGIEPIDVSVYKVCFQGACTTYFDVFADPEKMRRLVLPTSPNKITVYFQINVPQKNIVFMDVLTKMRTYEYLPAFVSQFVLLISKTTLNYEWLQPAILLDPRFAPGWKDPQSVPGFPATKSDEGLYKPSTELDKKMGWFQNIASRLGISVGVLAIMFILMISTVGGSILLFRYYYNKKTIQLAASKKIAPAALQPGIIRPEQLKTMEMPGVVLQDGIEEVPHDAVLNIGWGATSILNTESLAEVIEESVEQQERPKPAPPPPLPPGKMRRPQVSTPELKKLIEKTENVGRELETLIASIDDGPRSAISSRQSASTSTTAYMGADHELLQAMGFLPPTEVPSSLSSTRWAEFSGMERPSREEAGNLGGVEILSPPVTSPFKRPISAGAAAPEAAQPKIARLKRELDRLMAQDEEDTDVFDAAEANRSALYRTQQPHDDEEDDRHLFSGTRNYASLRGRFQPERAWEASSEPASPAPTPGLDDEAPFTPARRPKRLSAEVEGAPRSQSPEFFSPLSRTSSRAPRTPFSRQIPVRESPGPGSESPEPWAPGMSATDVFNTPAARRLLTGGMDSDFASTALPARSRRNLALLGSLSSSRPSIHDGHGSPRRPPPVATTWGNVQDEEAGMPYMPQRARPKTGKSPISANRQYYLPSERADALFQLTLPSEQRTHTPGLSLDGTWATTSSAAAESLYETPTTSPERRNQTQRRNQMPGTTPDRISQIANAEANAEAQSFSSPRSASRLLDDNLADEDLL